MTEDKMAPDAVNFGQASNMRRCVDGVGPYLYKAQQKLSNLQSYELRSGRVVVLIKAVD